MKEEKVPKLRSLVHRAIPAAGVIVLAGSIAGCAGPTTVIGRGLQDRGQLSGQRTPAGATATAQRTQILVKFKADLVAAELSAFRASYGLRNVGAIPALGVYVEEVADGRAAADVLRELQQSPLVAYAELNETISINP
jgi:hypothetical protein